MCKTLDAVCNQRLPGTRMSGNLWSARALGQRVAVPHSTVSHWIATGLVEPSRRGRGRRGHDLGITGLLELIAVRELRAAGIPLRAIRRAVEHLREITGHSRPLTQLVLLVVGNDVVVRDMGDDGTWVSALRHPTQRMMVFPIGDEHRRLVADLPAPPEHEEIAA